MRYYAIATDYDGTLAHHGGVEISTIRRLEKVRETGRKLLLVTGRRLEELLERAANLRVDGNAGSIGASMTKAAAVATG